MKNKISILYSWFIRTATFFIPDYPLFMRFRGFLYSLMMKKCGKDFQVSSSVVFNSLSGVQVGSHVFISPYNVFIGTDITIEDEVIMGPGCVISSGNHVFNNGSFRFEPSIKKAVLIKRGSWVAANCTITAGSILPQRSILAAGAVLSKPFTEYESIYGGIPARLIKKINK